MEKKTFDIAKLCSQANNKGLAKCCKIRTKTQKKRFFGRGEQHYR